MSAEGASPGAPAPDASKGGADRSRYLPLLLAAVALLPDLGAALPLRSYFFRDFTVTFLPLRLFAARELREGRLPFWNPYLFEGAFQLPALYPADLLQALWPTPAFVSWLLSLHLPLAALGAYALARDLGCSRPAAFVSGAVLGLCGFSLSTLNLYVFLQALALAPFVALLLRRAASHAGRAVAGAAVLVALATSTLAVEFVAQAVVLGAALGLAASGRRALPRLALAIGLGGALAALPVAVMLGLLPETTRGAGLPQEVALANSVHPLVLLQSLLPRLFGDPAAPAEAWWGGRFFSKGLPYFLSIYLGPNVLALAALGAGACRPRLRLALLAPAALGLWYSLGPLGGLAPLVQQLPLSSAFRFPSKALLLVHLALAVLVGFGVDALRRRTHARAFVALAAGCAAAALGVAALTQLAPARVVAWSGVLPAFWPTVSRVAWADAATCGALAAAAVLLVLATRRRWLSERALVPLLTLLLVADLARAGAGLNRQVDGSFFDLRPGTARAIQDPDGGRVFSYGVDASPGFRAVLARGGPQLTTVGLYLDRQVLGPYTNVLDRAEAPEAADLTAFAPRLPELGPELYDPRRAGELLPWLRNAAVSRVVSLDPLDHPAFQELAATPAGVPGVTVRVYGVAGALPRVYVACRVLTEPSDARALSLVYGPGFDPRADVVLAEAQPVGCTGGTARSVASTPGRESFEVQADGPGVLLVRGSYARGWRASVDGRPAPVWRANGKHRAVPIPRGARRVDTWYSAPGLTAGLWTTLLAAAAVVAIALPRGRRS